eukprot:2021703-Amphidinium_carterae.1
MTTEGRMEERVSEACEQRQLDFDSWHAVLKHPIIHDVDEHCNKVNHNCFYSRPVVRLARQPTTCRYTHNAFGPWRLSMPALIYLHVHRSEIIRLPQACPMEPGYKQVVPSAKL